MEEHGTPQYNLINDITFDNNLLNAESEDEEVQEDEKEDAINQPNLSVAKSRISDQSMVQSIGKDKYFEYKASLRGSDVRVSDVSM